MCQPLIVEDGAAYDHWQRVRRINEMLQLKIKMVWKRSNIRVGRDLGVKAESEVNAPLT